MFSSVKLFHSKFFLLLFSLANHYARWIFPPKGQQMEEIKKDANRRLFFQVAGAGLEPATSGL
jgi:hypothetical protein